MSRTRIWATPASPTASSGTRRSAAKYPWYDLSRVGIFGTSAGGQNSLGGMLFHPEFYKVVVTNSGCHDNRMDKIWWNEQWMSWPLGPQYAASSNVDNAHKLQGKALIIIGEMDSNVDPTSSLQVVDALVKANKHFDMLFIPGRITGSACWRPSITGTITLCTICWAWSRPIGIRCRCRPSLRPRRVGTDAGRHYTAKSHNGNDETGNSNPGPASGSPAA